MKKGDQALYRDWLKETRFSDDYHKRKEQEHQYEGAVSTFFAADEPSSVPAPSKKTVEMQKFFIMNKTEAKPFTLGVGQQVQRGSGTFETMNQQFQRLYEEDSKNQQETRAFAASLKQARAEDRVDTGVISSGREGDDMWRTKKYTGEEFRKDLVKSTTRAVHNYNPLEAEQLRMSKFNIKKTPISEFSNASHNGTVFINPKFSSC